MNNPVIERGLRLLKRYRLLIVVVAIWSAILIASRQYMAANDLTINELAADLGDLLADHWYGALIYLVVYLVRPVLLLPASLITALAGNVWGLWLGFAIGMIAGTLSALIPYAAGRWFAPEEAVYERICEGDSRIGRFVTLLKRRPFQAVLTMRLLYFPYDTVSAVAGGLRIGFLPFFSATAIGNIAGTFAFVGIGASISGDITAGELELDPTVFLFSGGVLIVSLIISRFLGAKETPQGQSADVTDGGQSSNVISSNASGN